MVKISLEDLKERIDLAYDVESVVDILGITTLDILDAFEDKLLAKRYEFSDLEPEEDEFEG